MISPFVQVEAVVFGVMIAWAFWGFHTILFGWLVAVLGRRHPIRRFLLVTCFAGYFIATVTIALYSYIAWEYIRLGFPKAPLSLALRRAVIATTFAWCTSVAVSDSVQVWRCLVLCGDRKWLMATLGFLLGCTIVFGIINDVLSIVSSYDPNFASPFVVKRLSKAMLLAFLVPSILLNMIATGAVLHRVHAHSKDIIASFGTQHHSLKRLRLMSIFLLEGGVVYTLVQMMYAISSFLALAGYTHAQLPLAARPVVVVICDMYPVTITLFAQLARHMTDTYSHKGSSAGSSGGGSSIGLPLPRTSLPALRSPASTGHVNVFQAKVVEKSESDSIHDTMHSGREGHAVA